MSDRHLDDDLGLPNAWENLALALSPAPPDDWYVVPPVVSERLQPAMNLLDDRSRVILALWSDGEMAPSIGDCLGVNEEEVRRILYRSVVTLLGASALLRGECSAWLRDDGIDGSAVVRFAEARLHLGDWGQVTEPAAWRLLLSIMRRQGGPHRMVSLRGDRHLIVDHVRHRIAVVEPWLRMTGVFSDGPDLERGTRVPSKLLAHAVDAFNGAVVTKGGFFYSRHLRSVDLVRATALHLARHGICEWHFSHLAHLLRRVRPDRFDERPMESFADLAHRLPATDFQPSESAGWWRFVGNESSSLRGIAAGPDQPNPFGEPPAPARTSHSLTNQVEGPSDLRERLSRAIVSALRNAETPLTIHQLATLTGASTRDVHKSLFHCLKRRGVVKCTDGRRWALSTTGDHPFREE